MRNVGAAATPASARRDVCNTKAIVDETSAEAKEEEPHRGAASAIHAVSATSERTLMPSGAADGVKSSHAGDGKADAGEV